MEPVRFRHRHLDVACELVPDDVAGRVAEWGRLRDEAVIASEPIAGGVRLWLRASAAETARDLARREAACCGFLDLDLAEEAGRVRLDVTSSAPGAESVIAALTEPSRHSRP